uniref:Uncharacterized protein n=1 Tax=Timema shepardi TaxID=629360 RepID=A0A7R9B2D9_TIMSH|nr:unnamed protein product [Timema shepardi]
MALGGKGVGSDRSGVCSLNRCERRNRLGTTRHSFSLVSVTWCSARHGPAHGDLGSLSAGWLAVHRAVTSLLVSMMSGEGTVLPPGPIIKKEVEASSFQACSPSNSNMYSPTTTVMHSDMEYCESQDSKRYEVPQARSPGSPDQQYCSSTTQSLGDSMLGHPEMCATPLGKGRLVPDKMCATPLGKGRLVPDKMCATPPGKGRLVPDKMCDTPLRIGSPCP